MSDKVTLRFLEPEDEAEFLRVCSEDWGEFVFAHYWESLGHKDFKQYIQLLSRFPKGECLPAGHVPCTILYAFNSENNLVGRSSIRHELNEHLLQEGGHIGYGVSTSYRKRGYATAILEKSLSYMKESLPHIEKALVTCDQGNIGSQKTIERNNGKLENILTGASGVNKMRFWIDLK